MKQTEAQAREAVKAAKLDKKVSGRSHTFDKPTRSSTDSSSGTTTTTTTFEKSWANTKSWIGQGQKPRKYDGFEHVSHTV